MASLVIAEHDSASIKGATLNTVTAAAACGGGREQDVAVVLRDGEHLCGHVLRETVRELFAVGMDHLGHAGDLRGRLGRLTRVLAGY